jgi:hypothetical protein
VFIGLLLVAALACLCVGLLLSSAIWLIFSLVASVVAGLLVYRNRQAFSTPRRAAAAAGGSAPSAETDPEVWVIDGRPRYHRERCEIIDERDAEAIPLSQANDDGFIPCSLCEP